MRRFFLLCALYALGGTSLCLATEAATPPIDASFCRALVKHVPDADVAYQPGMDVRGRKVVPADLGATPRMELPEEITIPLTADLFHFLRLNTSRFPFNAMRRNDINLGTLTVRGDKVFYDGKPLTDEEQDNLAVLCLKPTK